VITISAIDTLEPTTTSRPGNSMEEGRDHVMTNLVSPRLWKLDDEAIMKKMLVKFRWMG
jgi:hypothetical protein